MENWGGDDAEAPEAENGVATSSGKIPTHPAAAAATVVGAAAAATGVGVVSPHTAVSDGANEGENAP